MFSRKKKINKFDCVHYILWPGGLWVYGHFTQRITATRVNYSNSSFDDTPQ